MRTPRNDVRIRDATPADLPFLEQMLYEAANWRGGPAVPISRPEIAKYVRGWGTRAGDFGVVAEDARGRAIGAAWYRYFDSDSPGFGYVDDDVPELTIAVEARSRGRGVGRALLRELVDRAARRGATALSLSVEEDNPALGLYVSSGFEKVGRVENAWTMRRDLP